LTTKVFFYGGVDEIGGNKILLEEKGTKVFLDFGKSFPHVFLLYAGKTIR
jgi:mRNA degradation ribonuclease J1/J2